MTFAVQPVEMNGELTGYVVSGFMSRRQLDTLREFVDSEKYEKSKRWRGQYLEMSKAMVTATDGAMKRK